ncbi:MAG: zinc-ribbon domain-containing protein [Chloroflexota bacterium]|nr:zinc-ribbon domain-containing protein [Chloroflexota bacterium]
MEVTCTKCGTVNRGTSRFCSRCGSELPITGESVEPFQVEEPVQGNQESGLDLPWLRGVQDRASKPTENLAPSKIGSAQAGHTQQRSETPVPLKAGEDAPLQQPPVQQRSQTSPAQQAQTPSQQNKPADVPQPEPDKTPEPAESPPAWVMGILEPTAPAPPSTEQTYEPEELAHIMPWTHSEPGSRTGKEPQTTGASSLPPWLNDVTVQETLQAAQAGALNQNIPATPSAEDLGLEEIEPFMPPNPEEEAAKAQAEARPQEAVPEWLRTLPGRGSDETQQRLAPTGSLLERVAGPTIEPIVRENLVHAPRQGAVEVLAELIQPHMDAVLPRPVNISGVLPRNAAVQQRQSLRRWLLPDGIIYLAVLAILLPVLFLKLPLGNLSAPTRQGAAEFYRTIQEMPTAKPVLVAYDWDATRSAEMALLSRAVMNHLMSRHIRFVTISTTPQGPGFAQQIAQSVAEDPRSNYGYRYGTDYLILGYLPGDASALRALTQDLAGPLPLDYVNGQRVIDYPIIKAGKITNIKDFSMVIDLASEEADLRNWVEQVGTHNVPLIAAVPQGLEPLARPFVGIPGAGLKAIVSGALGALQYDQQLTQSGRASGLDANDLSTRLNAQSVAQLLVSLVIVAALIGMATQKIYNRREVP